MLVVKRNGSMEKYNKDKIVSVLNKAFKSISLEVSEDDINRIVVNIEKNIEI